MRSISQTPCAKRLSIEAGGVVLFDEKENSLKEYYPSMGCPSLFLRGRVNHKERIRPGKVQIHTIYEDFEGGYSLSSKNSAKPRENISFLLSSWGGNGIRVVQLGKRWVPRPSAKIKNE